MSKKFFTVKEWTIDKSKIEDMAIKIIEDGVEVKYDIPMEEAMTVIATIKKDVRHNPNCDFFEIHFGGKRHGFSRVGIIKFCDDLKVIVNECLAIRVFGTRVYKSILAVHSVPEDNADTNYLKMPETVSTSPKEPDLSDAEVITTNDATHGLKIPDPVEIAKNAEMDKKIKKSNKRKSVEDKRE